MPGRRRTAMLGWVVGSAALAAALTGYGQDPTPDPDWDATALPFLENHCLDCHRGAAPKGKLRLDRLARPEGPVRAPSIWRRVRSVLANREMPPKRVTPPADAEYGAMLGWLDGQLARWAPTGPVDPGRVTLRRLNRAEYTNTIRDLCGVAFAADAAFPADGVGYGFDNIGDVLSVPPILLEKYLTAAEQIAAAAIVERDAPAPDRRVVAGTDCTMTGKGGGRAGVSVLYTGGDWAATFTCRRDGEYRVEARAFGQQAGPEVARAEFRLDGTRLAAVDVPATPEAPAVYTCRFRARAGTHRLAFAFINDFYNPTDPDPRNRDRNLGLYHLALEGPLDPQALPDSHTRWLGADGGIDLVTAVHALTARAFRRPVSDAEVQCLCTAVERAAPAGASLETRFRLAMTAVLVSPHFLFRVELRPHPGDATAVAPLDDWALASRLSYFLWSSLPDRALFARAAAGTLHEPAVLHAEVDRMLRDPRASALAANFATQWLQVRALDQATPDPDAFPAFDPALRTAMRLETECFFEAILREDRPVWELLGADFTFVNDRLARHYGLPAVRGGHMRRVALDGRRPGGVLAHGSVLTATSNPTRTSPVRRGKWVLTALLDQPPDPPPPGLDGLDERPASVTGTTLRQRLEAHRADPRCAICHDRMDALGFALERFDPIGQRRDRVDGFPVDARGTLPDGRVIDGAAGLARLLEGDPAFLRSLAHHLLTYALGRGLTPADAPAVDAGVSALAETPTLRQLIHRIVQSDAFRLGRGESPGEGF